MSVLEFDEGSGASGSSPCPSPSGLTDGTMMLSSDGSNWGMFNARMDQNGLSRCQLRPFKGF